MGKQMPSRFLAIVSTKQRSPLFKRHIQLFQPTPYTCSLHRNLAIIIAIIEDAPFDRPIVRQPLIIAFVAQNRARKHNHGADSSDQPRRILWPMSANAPARQSWYRLTCCEMKMAVMAIAIVRGKKTSRMRHRVAVLRFAKGLNLAFQ